MILECTYANSGTSEHSKTYQSHAPTLEQVVKMQQRSFLDQLRNYRYPDSPLRAERQESETEARC